tara:strand:- start:121 stop:411 length:291 start_codon:yes stop_codon:yes gene_type:complete
VRVHVGGLYVIALELIMFGSSNIVDRTEDCGNGFGWSIIEWVDDSLYRNDYEFAVLRDGNICYDSGVTGDVVRGDWSMMEKLKCMVMDLEPNHLSS